MREACKPKPGWNTGLGHRTNSLGAGDDGYRIGMQTGSLGERVPRDCCALPHL